jgi:hypothetical protein
MNVLANEINRNCQSEHGLMGKYDKIQCNYLLVFSFNAQTGDSPFTDKYYLQIIYRNLINRLSSLFTDPNISFTKFYSPLA